MSACNPKEITKLCQTELHNITFFNHSNEPVCMRTSQAKFIYFNNAFLKNFYDFTDNKIPTYIYDIQLLSDENRDFLLKLEFECSFLSDSVAQSRNILINDTVWQVRIEMIKNAGEIYYVWQFNKFHHLLNINGLYRKGSNVVRYVSFRYAFLKLSNKEVLVFSLYLLGYSYTDISSICCLNKETVKKRISSALRKVEGVYGSDKIKRILLMGDNLEYVVSLVKDYFGSGVNIV